MRKTGIALLFVLIAGGSASTQDQSAIDTGEPQAVPPATRDLSREIASSGDALLSELTVSELGRVAELLSVAAQQHEFVTRASNLSLFVSGLGQFAAGDTFSAVGFLAADLTAGVAFGAIAYLFLPPSVQYRNLNYLQSPISAIGDEWKQLTPGQLIPSVGALVSGAIVRAVIRRKASEDAARAASLAIENGEIVFEPDLGLLGTLR